LIPLLVLAVRRGGSRGRGEAYGVTDTSARARAVIRSMVDEAQWLNTVTLAENIRYNLTQSLYDSPIS
jgi:hypothetical protein